MLSPEEWESLVDNEVNSKFREMQMLQLLAHAPHLIRRARQALGAGDDPTCVRGEMQSLYEQCKLNLSSLRIQFAAGEASDANRISETLTSRILHAYYQRAYGIGLLITISFNCMISALGGVDGTVVLDSTSFAEEALALARRSAIYRPIGAAYQVLCLAAAWAVAPDPQLRLLIEAELKDYQSDFRHRSVASTPAELEWVARHMRVGLPFRKGVQTTQ